MKALPLLLVLAAACGARGGVEPSPEDRAPTTQPAPSEDTVAQANEPSPNGHHAEPPGLPEGHPAIGEVAPPSNLPTIDGTPSAGGIVWTAPPELEARPPASSMRVAEYALKDTQGSPTELAVFFFGQGQGGSVEDNIDRWTGQMRTAEGGQVAIERLQLEVAGVRVTRIETSGTLAASTMGTPQPERPDHHLFGAIAEGPGGMVFFKMTGPNADAERAEAAFNALIASIHPG